MIPPSMKSAKLEFRSSNVVNHVQDLQKNPKLLRRALKEIEKDLFGYIRRHFQLDPIQKKILPTIPRYQWQLLAHLIIYAMTDPEGFTISKLPAKPRNETIGGLETDGIKITSTKVCEVPGPRVEFELGSDSKIFVEGGIDPRSQEACVVVGVETSW